MSNKLQMRRLGPCTIRTKYGNNACKMELPEDIWISPIFNVEDMVSYKGPTPNLDQSLIEVIQEVEKFQLPSILVKKVENILDSRIYKKTRHKFYWEYLFKWHGNRDEKATWIKEIEFQKLGIDSNLIRPVIT